MTSIQIDYSDHHGGITTKDGGVEIDEFDKRVLAALENKLESLRDGKSILYIKSKQIPVDGTTARKGRSMAKLGRSDADIQIGKWNNGTPTTWEVKYE